MVYAYERGPDLNWHFLKYFTPEEECKALSALDKANCLKDLTGNTFSMPTLSKDDEIFVGASKAKHESVATGKVYMFHKTEAKP